ncbi:MAG: D-alanyl-D-alanine carboxypeptidase/D-alanyl-D-alanine-endopeptidase [Acidobacteriota bacterium]|nr:D-alanyl-D-alanine carboxypeptidase/D-alanyl-D-alanine-endopeptidase [Acidobacteriota bacterium]
MKKLAILLCAVLAAAPLCAQNAALSSRVRQLAERPELRHSTLGVKIVDETAGTTLVDINSQQLFNAGSTTKLLTEGTALALLGEDYRFHTRIYYTGQIDEQGVLEGDLILVAGGDPNLSGRVLPTDTLDIVPRDHAYAGLLPGQSVPGEPLRILKELAASVLMKGVARIRGNILVDASLFAAGGVEPATHTAISPVVLNDNVIDVIATSARNEGGAVALTISPELPYLKVINRVRTGPANSDAALRFTTDVEEAGGSHTAVLEGNVPAGRRTAQAAYKVQDPVRYAEAGMREALHWVGVVVEAPWTDPTAPVPPASTQRTFLTEHISPPFREEARLTLKVSQNLHAALTPFLLGSLLGKQTADAQWNGLTMERRYLTEKGLDTSGVSQLDGEGGMGSAFTPDFMVRYLEMMSHQPTGRWFAECLPVLGRDGTLAEVLEDSPAAGHVHAKTGSYVVGNALSGGVMLLGKGLAGYIDGANGHRLVFAAYINMVPLRGMDAVADLGEMLAKIAEAAYESTLPSVARAPARIVPAKAAGKPSPRGGKKALAIQSKKKKPAPVED